MALQAQVVASPCDGSHSRMSFAQPRFQPGQPVRARFQAQIEGPSLTKWYKGFIRAVYPDEAGDAHTWLYDVDYIDGDFEAGVPEMYVRERGTCPTDRAAHRPHPAPPGGRNANRGSRRCMGLHVANAKIQIRLGGKRERS